MTTTTATRFLAAVPALPVSDERRAVAFFESALGFVELRHEGEGLGILRRDAVEVHVWVADGSAPGAERQLAGSASCGSRSPASRSSTSTASSSAWCIPTHRYGISGGAPASSAYSIPTTT